MTPEPELEFDVSGMTCGSCSARVEKILSRQPGVARAAVNLATERATVTYGPDTPPDPDHLVTAVAKAGYGLTPTKADGDHRSHADERVWRDRLLVAWPLGLVIMVLGIAFMHAPWARYLSLVLAIPVQFWAGWPFLSAAATRARSGTANMDTLIAIGTLTAFTFSTYQVVWNSPDGEHYFDTAALIIAFLLLGRWFEAKAKARATNAIAALGELGAKEARLLDVAPGAETLVAVERVVVGDRLRVRPGEKIPVDG